MVTPPLSLSSDLQNRLVTPQTRATVDDKTDQANRAGMHDPPSAAQRSPPTPPTQTRGGANAIISALARQAERPRERPLPHLRPGQDKDAVLAEHLARSSRPEGAVFIGNYAGVRLS
jgi:hypothetical protein